MSVGQPCLCGALDCEKCYPGNAYNQDDEPDPYAVAREMDRARRRPR
jgi:hypothetical protein